MRSPREDIVLGYDALVLDDVFIYFNFHYEYVKHVSMTLAFTHVKFSIIIGISYPTQGWI